MLLYIILAAVAMFLSLVGLSVLTSSFWRWLNRGEAEKAGVIIIPVSGHNNQIELELRRVHAELCCGKVSATGMVVVNMGADAETADICRRFCRQYNEPFLENGYTVEQWLAQDGTKFA